ncbi:hypothetical protein LTR85_002256 [Meristemomyces frigidus]|nr:hypothetical protein LTR85_002256 [Meristemomyces frigidus]
MANCLAYPYIAISQANGTLRDPTNLTAKYQIPTFQSSGESVFLDPADLWPVINKCIVSYCDAFGTGNSACNEPEEYSWRHMRTTGTEQMPASPTIATILGLCAGVIDTSLNPDIGGIGVIISYIMQILIVWTTWMAQSIARSLLVVPSFCIWLLILRDRRLAYTRASRLQHKVSSSKQVAALMSALVEFQKTQVFFILTVQAASLVAMHNSTYLQASSWGQYWMNVSLFSNIAKSGLDPIVFGLLILRKVDKASAYLLGASTCCIIVSLITWRTAVTLHIAPKQIASTETGSSECGHVVPTMFCLYGPPSGLGSSALPLSQLVVTLVIHSCIIVERVKLFSSAKDRKKRNNIFRFVNGQAGKRLRKPFVRLIRSICSLTVIGAELWMMVINISEARDYWILLENAQGGAWALGQIIAVAVWVPVIIEWLYLSIGGIEKGFKYRLVAPYHVVKKYPQDSASSDDSGDEGTTPTHLLITAADDDDAASFFCARTRTTGLAAFAPSCARAYMVANVASGVGVVADDVDNESVFAVSQT